MKNSVNFGGLHTTSTTARNGESCRPSSMEMAVMIIHRQKW
jgi:hypothetical protein